MFARCRPVPAVLLLLVASCASQPAQSVREHYIASRRHALFVDISKPCRYEPMRPMPIKVIHHRLLVPVEIDGVSTVGMLDTGSDASYITPDLAKAAKLTVTPDGFGGGYGIAGGFVSAGATLKELAFGSLVFKGPVSVRVLPFGGANGTRLGALIGQDYLDRLDWDMDLKHESLIPYRTSNCAAIDPPWPDTFTGLALTRGFSQGLNASQRDLATSLGLLMANTIPVQFDGGSVNAMFDTGATISFLSPEGARKAGVTAAMLKADTSEKIAGIDGRVADARRHVFPEIAVGEEAIHDLPMLVAEHSNHHDPFDMILGMDYIENNHIWLSYTTNALYIDSGERGPIIPSAGIPSAGIPRAGIPRAGIPRVRPVAAPK